MSKVVKVIALVVIAVAVIVFAPQIAGFLATTFGGAAVSAATIAAITSTIVGIGLSIGLTAIGTLFRKSASLSQSMADRLNTTVVPTAPRKIVFGRTGAGADVRFFETYGSKKDRYVQVIALASHKLNAIREVYFENDLRWSGGALVNNTKSGLGYIRAVTEGAPGNGQACGSGGYWTAASTFTGCGYIVADFKLDNEAWPQGIPSRITTVVEGCPLYDPRQDSTRGGSGSHRAENQSTWQFTSGSVEIGRNPALALLTYLIGYRINGRLAWGMGVPVASIDLDNFRLYANICEERVAVAGGGTVQRYTGDGIVSTSDTFETVINALTAAMGSCKLTDVGGRYCLIGGYDDSLGPIQSFDENDLVGGIGSPTPYNWVPAGPSRETYNVARGRFADPAQLYQLADWGSIETNELPDGIPRVLTLDLGFVNRAETCQRIAKQFLAREAKTPGFFSAVFGPKAFAVQVGDLCTLSLPSQGWNNKLFRVQEQHEVHDMIYQMTLREESPEVYAWDKDEALVLPSNLRPPGYDPSLLIAVDGLSVTSTTYQGVA